MYKKIALASVCLLSILAATAQTAVEYLDSPIHATNLIIPNVPFTKGKGDTAMSVILLDGGYLRDERVPANPYKIVHLNLMNGNYDIIPVVRKNSTDSAQTAMGRYWSSIWGMNSKYYFCSQDPGSFVEFNPSNNQVRDFGSVVANSNGIYTLANGRDSAIYGGSWGYSKYLVTFRYDPRNDSMYTHNALPLNMDENSYVTSITGDRDYTYAVVGKDHYKLYALHRATNTLTLLRDRTDGGVITLLNTADSTYFFEWHLAGDVLTHKSWVIQNGTETVARPDNSVYYPASSHPFRSNYNPIPDDTAIFPQVIWDQDNKKALWRFKNDTLDVKEKTIPEVYTQTRTVGGIMQTGPNEITGAGAFYSRFFKYDISTGTTSLLGTTPSLYSQTLRNNKVYFGSYGGYVLKYNPDTVATTNVSFSPLPMEAPNANPRLIATLRNTAGSNTTREGPAIINGISFLSDTSLAFCGPIDTDGSRAGQGSSIGTFTLSGTRTYCTDTLLAHTYISGGVLGDNQQLYCFSFNDGHDNPDVYIYKYNPVTNLLEKRIPSPFPLNTGTLTKGLDNQLVGWLPHPSKDATVVYFLSEITDGIYKTFELSNRFIWDMKLGYDNMLWALTSESQAETSHFSFYKINPHTGQVTHVHSFDNPAGSTGYRGFTFIGGTAYLSGSQRLARVNNLTVPVSNSYLTNYEKLNKLFDFQICE